MSETGCAFSQKLGISPEQRHGVQSSVIRRERSRGCGEGRGQRRDFTNRLVNGIEIWGTNLEIIGNAKPAGIVVKFQRNGR